jgi:tellurite methyltransferase
MPSSQSEWDARHKLAAAAVPSEPSGIVRELLPLLPNGPALDIACGTGRHALFLAARGQSVTAVDYSGVALDILQVRAQGISAPARRRKNWEAAADPSKRGSIELIQADLEQTRIPEQRYDLILCVNYLQRSLFAQMTHALRPGGILLFETFTSAQTELAGGPRNPAFFLEAGELRQAFPPLSLLFYRELRAGQGLASLLAKKPGKKGS